MYAQILDKLISEKEQLLDDITLWANVVLQEMGLVGRVKDLLETKVIFYLQSQELPSATKPNLRTEYSIQFVNYDGLAYPKITPKEGKFGLATEFVVGLYLPSEKERTHIVSLIRRGKNGHSSNA